MAAKKLTASQEAAGVRGSRVRVIAGAMADGTYTGTRDERTQMREAWAREWGVSEGAVRHYVAEAHRVIALDPAERKSLQREMIARYIDLLDRAATLTSRQTGMPDMKAELEAMRDLQSFLGLTESTSAADATRPAKIEVILTRAVPKKPEPPKAA